MTEKPPFSGTVKEYTVERYIGYRQGKVSLDYKTTFKYDETNKLKEVHHYNSKNKLTDVSYYGYNNLQNISEFTVKTARGNKKQHTTWEYFDDKSYQVTSILKGQRNVTKYDEYDNAVESIFYIDSNQPPNVMKYINKYDDKKQLIEKQTYLPNGELDSTIKYKYNNQGLLIEERRTNTKTTWVVNGREIGLGKNHDSQYFYNDNKDVILAEFYSDGKNTETHKKEITYDESKYIIEIKDFRKGYVFQSDQFILISITKYSYIK